MEVVEVRVLSWAPNASISVSSKNFSKIKAFRIARWYKRVVQMVLAMTRPTKHPKTGIYQFRKTVPKVLRDIAGKIEIKISLGTKDPEKARRKYAEVALQADAELDEYRRLQAVLSRPVVSEVDETTIKHAGEVYYAYLLEEDNEQRLDGFYDETHFAEYVENKDDFGSDTRYLYARGMTDVFFEGEVDEVLSWPEFEIQLAPDSPSRPALVRELQATVIKAAKAISARNEGEPIETPSTAHILPGKTVTPSHVSSRNSNGHSLTSLLEGWWKEAQATGRKPSTYESYRNTIASFVKFLGHDDASRVTPANVVAFKDHRLASVNPRTGKPVSPKTVKDSDLAGLKTVFGWAVSNLKIPSNPAQGITIKLGKETRLRSKGLTDAEAAALLRHADNHRQGNEKPKMYAAKRWIPWLCAYTGARVGELAQLRKQDVRQENGIWYILITPEAGTVKTNEARMVALHEHLVEKGFPAFAAASEDGHLFLTPDAAGKVLGRLQALKNRLVEFAREVVTDENVSPNHGWRHRFKTLCREAGIGGSIMDAMQGHSAKTVGDAYGDVTVKAMANALAKFPKQGEG